MTEGRGSRVAGRGYQQLRAWQKGHALALEAFRLSETLRSQRRSLADQFVRSASSVPANIAEGYNRGSVREYIQFLNIARGSLAETEYYIIFIQDSGLQPAANLESLWTLADDTGHILPGLLRSLQQKEGRTTRMIRDGDSLSYGTAEGLSQDSAARDAVAYDSTERPSDDSATRDPRPATRPT